MKKLLSLSVGVLVSLGVQAQDVAKFAQYILDNEVEADEKVQNDFYHILGEELALTEEEYENLF